MPKKPSGIETHRCGNYLKNYYKIRSRGVRVLRKMVEK